MLHQIGAFTANHINSAGGRKGKNNSEGDTVLHLWNPFKHNPLKLEHTIWFFSSHSNKVFVNCGKYNFRDINSNVNYVLCYCFAIIIVIRSPSSYIQISAERQWWNTNQVVVNQCNFIAFMWTVLHTRKNISNTYLWIFFLIKSL